MRLIDADALAKAFREASETDDRKNNRTYWSEALISAAEEVDDAPTVDAVEVVRCEDCLWFSEEVCLKNGIFLGFKSDFFCADGERRSE